MLIKLPVAMIAEQLTSTKLETLFPLLNYSKRS